jgi:uncharacterized membrane protein
MPNTIGNPLSWTARQLGRTGEHLSASTSEVGGKTGTEPVVSALTLGDLRASLRAGWDDFLACRTDAILAVLIYPLVGLALIFYGFRMEHLPKLFPLLAGFALLGPVAAVGLYEMSRRRELGETVTWTTAFSVVRAPSFGAIVVLGFYLLALFLIWMLTALTLYNWTLGPEAPASASAFLSEVFTTGAGWTMLILGIVIGFLFALCALAISVVSFPLLLERHVGVPVAIVTSVRVLRASPVVTLTWGAIVALGLILGSLPFLAGLIVVIPVLGHATWHIYRRAVA